jgi:hypothetical protein
MLKVDWRSRWTGGFCPLGAQNGLPIRHAEYKAHPPLADVLILPEGQRSDPDAAKTLWSSIVGMPSILLVRSAYQAGKLLLRAANVVQGEAVGLPANATRDLTESVKHHGAQPRFLDLDSDLRLMGDLPRVTWSQVAGGALQGADNWQDYSDTLPVPGARHTGVSIYGLHLDADPAHAGALIVFGDAAADLYQVAHSLVTPKLLPDLGRAAAQALRLQSIARQQQNKLCEVYAALQDAAALPMLPVSEVALGHGVWVCVPPEADAATFLAYVEQENTPVRSLTEIQPLHYAAVRPGGAPGYLATGAHLARWLMVPVGPNYAEEEIKHAVLGIVKAADYLGVRWYCDHDYAREYAALMDRMYGEAHDAYRPVFEIAR